MCSPKPRLPVGPDEEPVIPRPPPSPPSNPLELREGGGWPRERARILRAGSLTTLPPVSRPRQSRWPGWCVEVCMVCVGGEGGVKQRRKIDRDRQTKGME